MRILREFLTLVLCIHITGVQGQTVGGNSDGLSCMFPFIYEGAEYNTCIEINHDIPWCSTTRDYDADKRWGECMAEDLANLPSFVSNTPTNVSVYQGQRARLMCSVNNLQGKKVTWQLKDAAYPLTVSTFIFPSNGKYSVEHEDESGMWNLIIDPVDLSHSGIYQCRVPTQTRPVFREIHLTVQEKTLTPTPVVTYDDDIAVTLGEKKVVYVMKGQELRLQCNSTSAQARYSDVRVVPPEVEWFRGDGNVINSHDNNDIVINTQVMNGLRVSTLIIERSDMDDAGVYICRNTEQVHDEVTVRIMNVDLDKVPVKRGTISEKPNVKFDRLSSRNSAENTCISFSLILGLLFLRLT